jgi:hypothetical protein
MTRIGNDHGDASGGVSWPALLDVVNLWEASANGESSLLQLKVISRTRTITR